MRIDKVQKRPLRFSPILFRRIHKWVGLILGVQFILWTVSGAVMALLDMEEVGGHGGAAAAPVITPWPQGMSPPPTTGPVQGLALRRIVGRPVYELRAEEGLSLLDARTGRQVMIDGPLAAKIARAAYHHRAPVRSIERIERPNLEARDHEGPMWRVNFADTDNSSSYVSATSGLPLVNRNDSWRTWDFVWMLHNMDYAKRTSFNHPLIIFAGFSALWLSLTGFYLLFKTNWRPEQRWLRRRPR